MPTFYLILSVGGQGSSIQLPITEWQEWIKLPEYGTMEQQTWRKCCLNFIRNCNPRQSVTRVGLLLGFLCWCVGILQTWVGSRCWYGFVQLHWESSISTKLWNYLRSENVLLEWIINLVMACRSYQNPNAQEKQSPMWSIMFIAKEKKKKELNAHGLPNVSRRPLFHFSNTMSRSSSPPTGLDPDFQERRTVVQDARWRSRPR